MPSNAQWDTIRRVSVESRVAEVRKLGSLFAPAVRVKLALVLAGTLVMSAAEVFAALLVPVLVASLLTGQAVDSGPLRTVLPSWGAQVSVALLTLLVIGVFVLKDLASLAFRYATVGFLRRQEAATAETLMARYLHESVQEHTVRSAPVAMRRLNESVSQVYSGAVSHGIMALAETLTVVSMIVAVTIVLPGAAVVVPVGGIVLTALALLGMGIVAKRAGRSLFRTSTDRYRLVLRSLGSFRELQLRGTQPAMLAAYAEALEHEGRAARAATFAAELPRHVIEIGFLLALGGAVLATGSSADVPRLGILVVAAFRILPSLSRALSSYAAVRTSWPAVHELAEELSAHTTAPMEDDGVLPFESQIELDDVWFRYGENRPWVLKGVSGAIVKNSRIALVGISGSGKSTLVDILTGLLPGYVGTIRVDGVPLGENVTAWRKNISVVPQDPYIAEATLAENIAFALGAPIDQGLLEECARRAQLDDLVLGLPDGYDTTLPERGVGLSGGQRQRIAIARALYRRTPILILDEATSALDNETEYLVERAIAALPEQLTVILIAHRLSTLRNVEVIAVLEDGQLAAAGTFDEVRASSPSFQRWVELSRIRPGVV